MRTTFPTLCYFRYIHIRETKMVSSTTSTLATASLFTLGAFAATSANPDTQVTTSSDGQCYNGNGVAIKCPAPSTTPSAATTAANSASPSAPAATSGGDAVRDSNVRKAVCHAYDTTDVNLRRSALQEDCAPFCGNLAKPDNIYFRSVTCDASTPAGATIETHTNEDGG